MANSYIVKQTGNSGSLKLTTNKLAPLKDNEVRVKNLFVSVNHFDIHQRKGDYKVDEFPFNPGISGGGEVIETGRAARGFKIGQKVVYGTSFIGSYMLIRGFSMYCGGFPNEF